MALHSVRQTASSIVDTVGNLVLSPPYGGFGYYHNHGPRTEKKVALTFDDGPNKPSTEILLDTLGELGVPATFFCLGIQAQYHPDLIARIDREGHVIGNHSMRHARKDTLMLTGGSHIDENSEVLSQLLGRRPRLFRPPWGWLTPWEGQRLMQRGFAIIGWDVYTLDWKVPEIDGRTLAEGMYRDTRPGSIILLHDSNGIRPESQKVEMTHAVRHLVPRLRADGYEFVTVPKLLSMPAYVPLI